MALVKTVIELLNRYANLLLVVITTTYVWFTWRTLKALQRASLRDRELRHVEDMKQYVARPLIEWLDKEAVPKLKGNSPLIQVKSVAVPRANAAIGEWAYDYQRQLDHTLADPPVFSSDLFSHARRLHFPEQLAEFELFLGEFRRLVSDCAALARECADKIASSTGLQRAPARDNVPEVADSDSLVEVCLRDIILGTPVPQIGFQVPAAGALQVNDAYVARPLGRGLTQPTKAWAEGGVALIQEQWAKRGLRERIDRLLMTGAAVHKILEGLEFTYALDDCEYIGGRGAT